MDKTLDRKLAALRANPGGRDFIICYAADPDLAAGVSAQIGPDRAGSAAFDITGGEVRFQNDNCRVATTWLEVRQPSRILS